ncbi:MFS transporter [Frondihabitans sp. Leaf304]|uniref:MFS transporter n=1 Tax=Frondihabitans sp. Leaf304 TaxID=1736329 RepID=UPI000A4B5AE1|nr:MFS transporter [Frondihabitans sp. Leaf304]
MNVDTGAIQAVPSAGPGPTPGSRRGGRAARGPWILIWGAVFVCSWGGNQFSPLLLMYEDRQHYSSVLVNAFLGVYVLGLAPALLVAGSLSDRHGRKPVLLAGLGAALVGSSLLALGPFGPEFLLVGRLFSGATVGVAMAVGNSWIKELSQAPFDPGADRAAGARRASLAFTLGSGSGALVAGLIAQWGPIPEVLPFVIHLLVTIPFVVVVLRAPESHRSGGVAGPWWRQLRIPTASHRRFVRVVVVSCPWIFAGAAIGYGYLPTQLRAATGSWGLVFATAATVTALGVSSALQPVARRIHSATSARGLAVMVGLIAAGLGVVIVAIALQSVWIGLAANVVIGVGMGIGLVSGLQEVQRIAGSAGLAGLTGVFYAVAYVGFLAPLAIAALSAIVPVTLILLIVIGLALVSLALVLVSFRKHLPAA